MSPGLGFVGSAPAAATDLYALFNGQNGDGVYAIGAMQNLAGAGWTEPGSSPVLQKTGAGWESAHVKDPWILWDGSQFVIFYAGYDGTSYRIGRATAATWADVLAGTITRYGSNPILTLGSGGAFDEKGCAYPVVWYDPSAPNGHKWWLWYSGVAAGGTYSMGLAHSDNGTSWTKDGQVLTAGSGWESVDVGPGAIYYSSPNWTMIYGGRGGSPNRSQGGLLTFTSPTGTYTRGGSNPVLTNRYGLTPPVSAYLTANTPAGGTSVQVADSSSFEVGEPVLLVSTTVEAEAHTILAIPDSTHITLKEAAVAAFTTAATAGIRSFAFNSVGAHGPIRPITGGYEVYFGPFQPLDNLSPAPFGETLWEGSMRATSSSLTAAWSYDYTTGLLLPLSPETSGWHKFSAENQCVIAKP